MIKKVHISWISLANAHCGKNEINQFSNIDNISLLGVNCNCWGLLMYCQYHNYCSQLNCFQYQTNCQEPGKAEMSM